MVAEALALALIVPNSEAKRRPCFESSIDEREEHYALEGLDPEEIWQ